VLEKAITSLLILLPAGCLLVHFQRHPRGRALYRFLLVALTVVSVASFTSFGAFNQIENHAGRVIFHWHEIFHYYLGSKYYPELGNSGLYDAAALADAESANPQIAQPRIRDLSNIDDSIAIEDAHARASLDYRPRFSAARWRAFKADLQSLKSVAAAGWLDRALFDAGFNPPPTWCVIGTPLANSLPLSLWLPYIDVILLLVCAVLVYRSFGGFALLAFVLAFCTNYLSDYSWTMGSYLRFGWFLGLVFGICALKERRFYLAGLGFGLSAALILFPMVFSVGVLAGSLLAVARRRLPFRPVALFVAGAGTIEILLGGISLLMFGPDGWYTFLQRIRIHADTYFVGHIGYRKIAVWGSDVAHQNFWWADGLARFKEWNTMLRERWAALLPYHLPAMGIGVGAAVWATRRLALDEAALLVGAVLLFLFMIPANYYYVYLSLVPVVLFRRPSTDWRDHALVLAFFALLAGIYFAAASHRDPLVQNYRINLLVLGFLMFWIVVRGLQGSASGWIARLWRVVHTSSTAG